MGTIEDIDLTTPPPVNLDSFDKLLKDDARLIRDPLLTVDMLNVPSNAAVLRCAIDVGQALLSSDFYQIIIAFRSFSLTMKSCANSIWIDRKHLKPIDETWKRYFLLTMAPEEIYREVLMLTIKMKWMFHEMNGKMVASCSSKDEMIRVFHLVAEKAQYLPDDKFLDALQKINPTMKCMIFALNTRLPRGLRNLSSSRADRRDLFDEFFDDHSSLLRFPRQIHKIFSTRFTFPSRWRPYRRIDFTKKQNLSSIMLIGLSKKPQSPNQLIARLHSSSEKILLISECDTCYKFQQISEEQHKEIYFSTVIIHVSEDVYEKYSNGFDISKRASSAFDLLVKMLFNVKHDNFFVYDMLTSFRDVFRMKKSMGRLWTERNKYPPSDMLWKHLLLLSSAPESIYQEIYNLAWLNYKTSYDCSRLYSTYTTEIFAVLAKKSYVYGDDELLESLKLIHPSYDNAEMIMNAPLLISEDVTRRKNYGIHRSSYLEELFTEVAENTENQKDNKGMYYDELEDISSVSSSCATRSRNSLSESESAYLVRCENASDFESRTNNLSNLDPLLVGSVSSLEELDQSIETTRATPDAECNMCKMNGLVDALRDNIAQYQHLHKCGRANIRHAEQYEMIEHSFNVTPLSLEEERSIDSEDDYELEGGEMSPAASGSKCSCSTSAEASNRVNEVLSVVYVLQPLTNLIERLQKLGYRIDEKFLSGILTSQ